MQAGNPHRELQRLFVVQPRIDLRLVRPRKIGIGETARAARAFSDVFARQFEVHATEPGTQLAVNTE